MTDLHTKAQALTKLEAERELVRLWELEESLKPRPIETAPKDTWILINVPGTGAVRAIQKSDFTLSHYWFPHPEEGRSRFTWADPDCWWPLPQFNLEGEK